MEKKLDKKNTFDVEETFMALTEFTVNFGQEHTLKPLLPKGVKEDEYGNYFYVVGEDSRTMFTAHLDDVSWGRKKVVHKRDGEFIVTDGSSILGADDKAGVTILMYMIDKGILGTYYFFCGEESGMQGAKGILHIKKDWFVENFDRCVSFDRRGYGSIISRQIGRKGCSDEFVEALKKQYDKLGLPHRNDPGGIFTDSASFIGIIPECTNISVGYFSEHTSYERQNIVYLEKLCKASIKIDWDSLPTIGVKDLYGGRFSRYDDEYDDRNWYWY